MDLKKVEEAGNILDTVLKRAIEKAPKSTYIELAEFVENEIRKLGGEPAFPCNLSTNEQAAHYTPFFDDNRPLNGVVKIDCGVHVEGWIADAAVTVDLTGEYGTLVEAAEEALDAALSVIRAGVEVKEVGKVVEEVAKKYGFKPIENLGGHSLERYVLHAGLFVPNVPKGSGRFSEGMLVAIEPFISTGVGKVVDSNPIEIFSLTGRRSRSSRAERVRQEIEKSFNNLPFARRWLVKRFGSNSVQWLKLMILDGSIHPYPTLVDPKGVVAQAEATVIVEKDGVRVTAGKRGPGKL